MVKISLIRLTLKNFKGIQSFTFEPNGENATIWGPNGTGKTTVADGFMWLLDGKTQSGAASFSVKPLDENGKDIPLQMIEAEAVIKIESDEVPAYTVTLAKVMRENYVTKRGRKEEGAKLQGNVTDYFINQAPKKEAEFIAFLSSIAPLNVLRLVSNINQFNDMKWQDRRRHLVDIAGQVSDADVIAADPKFEKLPVLMGPRSFDETKAMIKGQRPKVVETLKAIPARSDEAKRGMPLDIDCIPPSGPSYSVLSGMLVRLQTERADILAGGTSSIREQIIGKKEEISTINAKHRKDVEAVEAQRRNRRDDMGRARNEIRTIDGNIQALTREQQGINKDQEALLEKYYSLAKQRNEGGEACPTCKRELPDDNSEAGHLKKDIITNLDRQILDIIARGKAKSARLEEIAAEIARLTEKSDKITEGIKTDEEIAAEFPLPTPPDISGIETELLALEKQLDRTAVPSTEGIDRKIEEVKSELEKHDKATVARKIAAEKSSRIEELKEEQKNLSKQLDEIDQNIMLCEDFERAKSRMLESHVSKIFAPLSFRLFVDQMNGGLAETCETLIPSPEGKLVPWSDANTGARVLAGVRIADVLGKHYGISAPKFVDNAESLTSSIPELDTQIIRLEAKPDLHTDRPGQLHIEVGQEIEF